MYNVNLQVQYIHNIDYIYNDENLALLQFEVAIL